MDDEPTGAEALAAEPVATEEAEVETSEATTEQPLDADESNPGPDEAAAPRRKPGVHNRIDELTRQKHDALREAEYWKAKAQGTVDIDSLEYDDQIVAKVQLANRQEQADTASERAQSLAIETFRERETEAIGKYPDYADFVYKGWTATPVMQEVIIDSEMGPYMAYHLGKNPAEAARIATLPAHRQAVELGKLEAKITAARTLPKQPPDPVQPVRGIKSGGVKDPNEMSFTEYRAWREANP